MRDAGTCACVCRTRRRPGAARVRPLAEGHLRFLAVPSRATIIAAHLGRQEDFPCSTATQRSTREVHYLRPSTLGSDHSRKAIEMNIDKVVAEFCFVGSVTRTECPFLQSRSETENVTKNSDEFK